VADDKLLNARVDEVLVKEVVWLRKLQVKVAQEKQGKNSLSRDSDSPTA